MAFTPNIIGQLYKKDGYDKFGQPLTAGPFVCQLAVVNAKRKAQKTSVRADSSASRGAADEITADLGRILFPIHMNISIGDMVVFDGGRYNIVSKHLRRSVIGVIDHIECDIEVVP